MPRQRLRLLLRTLFFALFVVAPPLDLLRYDLSAGHAWIFGLPWTLGIDGLAAGEANSAQAAGNLLLRVFLPLFGGAALFIIIAWRFGRLYCGWLCPHFSVVELINGLMRRASGKLSLWDKAAVPQQGPDGKHIGVDGRWWAVTILAALALGFVWAVVLLTYLLPPREIYANLWHGALTRNQALFIGIGTAVFALEFLLARHLFCRFGCAVGLFQSLAWMGNDRALVVDFDAGRARACADCSAACEHACPMRLKPRDLKRRMFTCTQCTQCVEACTQVQRDEPEGALLRWVVDGANAEKQQRRRAALPAGVPPPVPISPAAREGPLPQGRTTPPKGE